MQSLRQFPCQALIPVSHFTRGEPLKFSISIPVFVVPNELLCATDRIVMKPKKESRSRTPTLPIICVDAFNLFWIADGNHRFYRNQFDGTSRVQVVTQENVKFLNHPFDYLKRAHMLIERHHELFGNISPGRYLEAKE